MKLTTLAFAAGLAGLASSAQAMPLAPVSADDLVTQVAGGCGPGWHPNRWGRCVPNRWGPRYGYGPGFYGPRFYGPRVVYGYGPAWRRPHWRRHYW